MRSSSLEELSSGKGPCEASKYYHVVQCIFIFDAWPRSNTGIEYYDVETKDLLPDYRRLQERRFQCVGTSKFCMYGLV